MFPPLRHFAFGTVRFLLDNFSPVCLPTPMHTGFSFQRYNYIIASHKLYEQTLTLHSWISEIIYIVEHLTVNVKSYKNNKEINEHFEVVFESTESRSRVPPTRKDFFPCRQGLQTLLSFTEFSSIVHTLFLNIILYLWS